MIALHVFRDSERDAGGRWVVQKFEFQREVFIEQNVNNSSEILKEILLTFAS